MNNYISSRQLVREAAARELYLQSQIRQLTEINKEAFEAGWNARNQIPTGDHVDFDEKWYLNWK